MKRAACVLFAAMAFISTAAQGQVGVEFHLGGGITQPTGNFGDAAKLGWHGLATIALIPSHAPFAIQATGMYGENKFKVGSGKWKLSGALAEVRLDLGTSGKSRGYVMAGGGVFSVKAAGIGKSKAAFDAGAGFAYMASPKAGVFVEGRYVNVFESGSDIGFIPITVGVRIAIQ